MMIAMDSFFLWDKHRKKKKKVASCREFSLLPLGSNQVKLVVVAMCQMAFREKDNDATG